MTDREQRQARFRTLLEQFVGHYNKAHATKWRILEWLDDIAVSGRKAECLVGDDAPQLAIEHTLIQPFKGAREDDARFDEVFGWVERAITKQMPSRVNLVVDTRVLTPDIRRDEVRQQLAKWLLCQVPTLPEGRSVHRVPFLPREITVGKQSDQPPGLVVARRGPDEDARVADAKRALTEKEPVLARYKQRGLSTALLLQCDNIALDNAAVVARDVEAAIADGWACESADDIWIADTQCLPVLFRPIRCIVSAAGEAHE